ncbi:hypothetical protein HBI34_157980 [Parastagonospora nodorum]|nr:hypothetical protein HBI34_157980 [Parastagonospora nodorum]
MAKSADMLPTFTRIAPSIYEHIPSIRYSNSYTTLEGTDAPSLIILCTWTGAQCRYIAKYTEQYQRLFPSTSIMVIATTAKDLCLRNSKRKQDRLRLAIDRISSVDSCSASSSPTSILLHVFSEGGSNKACELAEAYFNTTSRKLPVSALCFDSTPGHPRFRRLCDALGKSLPPIPVLKHASLLVGSAILGAVWVTYNVFIGFENNVITQSRQRLLDPTHFDLSAPRCYMYSQEDALIAWQDIKEHAGESMDYNVPVNEVLFEGSGHVGHARQEPQRYWNSVMATWQTARAFEEKYRVTVLIEEIKSHERKRWSDARLISARVVVGI